MRTLLLVAHVGAAIALLGPVTSATSTFARAAQRRDAAAMTELHRVSRGYGTAAVAVPAIGFALAARIDAFEELWVILAIVLVVVGGALLFAVHLPAQRRAMEGGRAGVMPSGADLGRLRASAGLFASTWLVIIWLMVAKPT